MVLMSLAVSFVLRSVPDLVAGLPAALAASVLVTHCATSRLITTRRSTNPLVTSCATSLITTCRSTNPLVTSCAASLLGLKRLWLWLWLSLGRMIVAQEVSKLLNLRHGVCRR